MLLKASRLYNNNCRLDADVGEINNLLGNLRITNEGIENRNLDIVSEMINETGDDRSQYFAGRQSSIGS